MNHDEREALIALMDQPIMGASDGRTFTEMVVDAILAAGFRRSEVPEPSAEVRQVLAWIDHTLGLPMYQDEMHSDYDDGVVTTLKTVRKMLNGTSRPDASWRSGEPSDAQEPLDLKGLAEIIGDVVVDHAGTGPHSQRAITIRDTCADWPDLIAGEVQAQGFRRSLPLSNEALDAAFAAFRAHERGEEFNEFGEHVCSECGYAYSWPSGADGRQTVPARRRQRHIAREALRAAGVVGQEGEQR